MSRRIDGLHGHHIRISRLHRSIRRYGQSCRKRCWDLLRFSLPCIPKVSELEHLSTAGSESLTHLKDWVRYDDVFFTFPKSSPRRSVPLAWVSRCSVILLRRSSFFRVHRLVFFRSGGSTTSSSFADALSSFRSSTCTGLRQLDFHLRKSQRSSVMMSRSTSTTCHSSNVVSSMSSSELLMWSTMKEVALAPEALEARRKYELPTEDEYLTWC